MAESQKTIYIKFFAGVNGNSANALMQLVDQHVSQGYQKIVLLISSPGGTVFHGLSIFNYLSGIPVEVETHNFGSVDSIGVTIFAAGKKRYSVPDARFLLHPISATLQATLEENKLEEIIKGIRIDLNNIAASIAKATGKSEKEIVDAISGRTTLSPKQAKDFGLVHEIKSDLFPTGAQVVSINQS
jgi:ATP-dependent protease ClpP protease subunit